MLLIFIFFLLSFFIIHIILQRIFLDNLIYNFIIALILNCFIFFQLLFELQIPNLYKLILIINIILSLLIYLIVVQAIRSSIQIYILQNISRINNHKKFKDEDNKIFEKRIRNLTKNNIIIKKKNYFFDNSKLTLNLVYYFFLILKKLYNEKY